MKTLLSLRCMLSGVLLLLAAGTSPAADSTVRWLGSERYLHGVNVPWIAYGADFGTVEEWSYHGYSHTTADTMFANLRNAGVNSVRWWLFSDGRGAPEFSSTNGGSVVGFDSSVLSSLDDAILLAEKHSVYITFCLWDFGMLDNDSTPSGRGEHAGGHRNLIVDPAARQSFIDNALLPMLRHTVSNTTHTIGTHPNVMAWDIINEPEWGIDEVGGSDQPVTRSQMQQFIAELAGVIHSNANQLVTVGSASMKWNSDQALGAEGNWWSDAALTAFHPDGALDFYQVHYYGWMNGDGINWSYSPLVNSFASAGFDKPTIIGEFPGNADGTGHTLSNLVNGIRTQGYGGAWSWSYFGGDGVGTWADVADAYAAFTSNYTSEIVISPDHDSDADGLPDLGEYLAGADPTNPLDTFQVAIQATNDQLSIAFDAREANGIGYGGSRRYYGLDSTPSLSTGLWQTVAGGDRIAATNGPVRRVISTPSPAAFYRIRAWLEPK